MGTSGRPNYALLGRMLVASAAVIFLIAILIWNGALGVGEEIRPVVAGALTFTALADLGFGIVMLKRGGR